MIKPELTTAQLAAFHDHFAARPNAAALARAAQKSGLFAASEDPAASQRLHRVFSTEIETGKPTNQRHSGRCWSFAALNTLRHKFSAKYKVKDFELSQTYLFFWDRIERANTFFSRVIETADRPLDDRLVSFYFDMALTDGGQWANAAAIIEKYGVVPEYVMPDTANTKDTTAVASYLNTLARKDGLKLRELVRAGMVGDQLTAARQEMMADVYQVIATAFGEPAAQFDLEFKDDDKQVHQVLDLTPQKFYRDYFETNLADYVVLTNAPDHAFNQVYSLPSQDNVEGGLPIRFVNVDFDQFEAATLAQLKSGETVWVGNDVLQQMDRKRGLMDAQLFRFDDLLGVDSQLSKKDRLQSRQATVSHAMTLAGFNLKNGKPDRWKIENSWGKDNGDNGVFVMSEDWFEAYTYEVVINKKYLPTNLQELATQPASELAAWDSLM